MINMVGSNQWLATAVAKAFSICLAILCWLIAITYSIDAASHGNVIGPFLGSPNTSSAILKSSLKISLLRYSKGSTKRLRSAVYITKWPLLATNIDVLQISASAFPLGLGNVILFLLILATFRHFLAIEMSFLALIILSLREVQREI
jgi:hypothetical protein